MGLLDIFSGNAEDAAKAQKAGLNKGRTLAMGDLDTGLSAYKDYAGKAMGEYDAYAPTLQNGFNSYADALGLNGAGGVSSAQQQFQTSPGYQFQMDQAVQQALRSGSAQGLLGSGNTTNAITDRASGLANQEWGSYLDRLGGLGTQGLNVAQQQAGIQQGIGTQAYNTSGQKAGLNWSAETGIGNANAQQAQAEAGGILNALSFGTKLLGMFGSGGMSGMGGGFSMGNIGGTGGTLGGLY